VDEPLHRDTTEPRSNDRGIRFETAAPASPAVPSDEEAFGTNFGGVFYLINVALALELYGDFTRPLQAGLDLSLWDFLALSTNWYETGERLAPVSAVTAFSEDTLSAWFARRSRRNPSQPPGADSAPPPAWRAPHSWQTWVDDSGASLESLRPRHDSWRNWCDDVMPWMELRVQRTLGQSMGRFLTQGATVIARPDFVQVRFDLATHPLALRLAGLDRDPGWVPSAGTDVRFIYA
jgi:hypothetical protein